MNHILVTIDSTNPTFVGRSQRELENFASNLDALLNDTFPYLIDVNLGEEHGVTMIEGDADVRQVVETVGGILASDQWVHMCVDEGDLDEDEGDLDEDAPDEGVVSFVTQTEGTSVDGLISKATAIVDWLRTVCDVSADWYKIGDEVFVITDNTGEAPGACFAYDVECLDDASEFWGTSYEEFCQRETPDSDTDVAVRIYIETEIEIYVSGVCTPALSSDELHAAEVAAEYMRAKLASEGA